jgi:hypothetical protein
VQDYLGERLVGYKVPRTVTFRAALPREESGTTFKGRLKAPGRERSGAAFEVSVIQGGPASALAFVP